MLRIRENGSDRKRAAQLASFALVMRARSINNRFFDKGYYVRPQVFEIYDSKPLMNLDYRQQLMETSLNDDERHLIAILVKHVVADLVMDNDAPHRFRKIIL